MKNPFTYFIKRLSVRFSFIAIGLLFVVFTGGLISIRAARDISDSYSRYADSDAPRLAALTELYGYVGLVGDDLTRAFVSDDIPTVVEKGMQSLSRAQAAYRSYRSFSSSDESFSALLSAQEELIYALLSARDTYYASTTDNAAVRLALENALARQEAYMETARTVYGAELDSQSGVSLDLLSRLSYNIKTQFTVSMGTTLAILLVAGIAYFYIFRPLAALRRTAREVAQGAGKKLAPVMHDDELGDVARSFNSMLRRLRAVQHFTEEQKQEIQHSFKELERMDKQTAAERARFKQLLTSIADAVLVFDTDQKITLANETAHVLFGDHIMNKHTGDLCVRRREHISDGACVPLFGKALTFTEPKIYERTYAIIDPRGVAIPVSVTMAPVHDESGAVTQVIATFRDVRELVRLEEARVSFLSAASHQLRTPLSSMRWFLEMLLDGSLGTFTPEQNKILEDFNGSTLHMIDLVNVLLQFSRVEARRITVKPEPIELADLAKQVADSLEVQRSEKSQTIKVDADVSTPVQADKEIVWQVILNLLTNAINYGNTGSTIMVHIGEEGTMYSVAITDEGIGIPEKEENKIFEKFYRATNAQRAVPNGNGIGLALVKLLVEDWGGTIGFESEENKTTTFHFTIPKNGMKKRKGEVGLQV